jgi:hypothetical protein
VRFDGTGQTGAGTGRVLVTERIGPGDAITGDREEIPAGGYRVRP